MCNFLSIYFAYSPLFPNSANGLIIMSEVDNFQGNSQMKIGIVASLLLLAEILLFWYEDYFGLIIAVFFWFISIPALIVFLIAFFKSFRRKTEWHKAMFCCGIGVALVFAAYLLFRAPCFVHQNKSVPHTLWQIIMKNTKPKWWNCASICNPFLPTARQ